MDNKQQPKGQTGEGERKKKKKLWQGWVGIGRVIVLAACALRFQWGAWRAWWDGSEKEGPMSLQLQACGRNRKCTGGRNKDVGTSDFG